MKEFIFDLTSGPSELLFQVGFDAEIGSVSRWEAQGGARSGIFHTIPSGPVLISSRTPSAGNMLTIFESDDAGVVAAWVMGAFIPAISPHTIKVIAVPNGTNYHEYHSLLGPFIGIRLFAAELWTVEALGISERAPATMLSDPGPFIVVGGM